MPSVLATQRTGTTRTLLLHAERVYDRLRRADLVLIGATGLLLCIGMVFVWSASHGVPGAGEGAFAFVIRQLIFAGLGFGVFLALQRIEYPALLRASPVLYGIGMVLLVGVLFTRPVNGARAWFDLYIFKLQPAELMKPALIIALAHYLMHRESYKRLSGLAMPLLIWFAPLALLMKQPDLGTTLTLVPVFVAMIFAAGARLWHLGLMAMAGCGGTVLLWMSIMKDYQKRRVLAWLFPDEYRLNEAWQLLRSEISIGSGGLTGQGLCNSSQSGLDMLPEKHTDFIFAVVAEEGGFVVAALVVALLAIIVLSGLGIAVRTREPAGRLIAVGISTLLCSQVLVNMGVALGLLPTTGLTLPFVSYGGSSLLSSFICLGILVNIGSRQEPVLSRDTFR